MIGASDERIVDRKCVVAVVLIDVESHEIDTPGGTQIQPQFRARAQLVVAVGRLALKKFVLPKSVAAILLRDDAKRAVGSCDAKRTADNGAESAGAISGAGGLGRGCKLRSWIARF